MDTTHNFKKPYSSFLEGVASEHPDAQGQSDFQQRADEILARRKKARDDARNPQIQRAKKAAAFFSKSAIRKEEVEADDNGFTKCWPGKKKKGVKMEGGKKVNNCVPEEFELGESTMTSADVKKEEEIKKKYDPSGMKASMIKQYGPEKGKQVYFATIRKKAMEEAFMDPEEELPGSRRKPIENVASHPDPRVRKKAVRGMMKQMEKEYGGKWKSRTKDPAIEEALEDEDFDELDEAKLPRAERRARNAGKKGYDVKGKPTSKGGVHAFDVDETLFSHGVKGKPNVKVHINDSSGKRVKSLTNQEFNTHKLDKGHSYDFSEFRSAGKFSQTASPNKKVISQLKRLQKRGKNVQLITARDKFDKPEEFRQHFVRHGIKLSPGNIHYAGGMKGSDIGQKKVAVSKGLAKMGKTSSVHMYDDAAKVHKAFEAEKGKTPKLKIKTHLAKPNKRGEVMTRSYQATKEEFELWVNTLIDEGYDLSEFTIDELYEGYEELLDEAITAVAAPAPGGDKNPRPTKKYPKKINYTSPYNKPKKEYKEETELTPYEFWKSFIGEEEEVSDDTIIEETEEVIERTPTSYDYWKAVITEQGDTTKL